MYYVFFMHNSDMPDPNFTVLSEGNVKIHVIFLVKVMPFFTFLRSDKEGDHRVPLVKEVP